MGDTNDEVIGVSRSFRPHILAEATEGTLKGESLVQRTIVLISGLVVVPDGVLTGPYAIDVLNQISLDMAFIGVNGFDENGPGTVDEYEASVNHTMITRAQQTFIVADSSKFGKRSFTSISGENDRSATTIITDSSISQEWADRVTQQGYNLRIV